MRLHQFERETPGVELLRKAEWQESRRIGQDRAAARMILDGEATGRLTPNRTILDATSGNTGIAYAMVGAARGYNVKLCMPENASPERKMILRALGAELVLTNPLEEHRRRHPRSPPPLRGGSGPLLLSRPAYTTTPTGRRTTTRRRRRSSNRPAVA